MLLATKNSPVEAGSLGSLKSNAGLSSEQVAPLEPHLEDRIDQARIKNTSESDFEMK